MTTKKKGQINLHEILRAKRYDNGVICTYSYDPVFFEDYCLEKFNCLTDNGNLTVITDGSIYEQAILSPTSDKPKQANIRYLLHPIFVPGAFHAKLFLFASRDRGRLILGSANFTRPGLTSNAEMVAHYDFEVNKNESFLPIFQESNDFLIGLNKLYPSNALTSNLQALSRETPWLSNPTRAPAISNFHLIHNLETPMWDQLISALTAPVDAIFILSRYFDSGPKVLDKLRADLSPEKITIFTQNGITTLTPDWLKHTMMRDGTAQILLCTYGDEEHLSPLHAKAIALQTKNECIFAFGSANFTTPAMFRSARQGNVETLLVVKGMPDQFDIEALFDPGNSATALNDESLLQSAAGQEPNPTAGAYGIHLDEATLSEQKILLTIDGLTDKEYNALSATLTFEEGLRLSIPISREVGAYNVPCTGEVIQRLGKSSTVIHVEARQSDGTTIKSNPLLITNLIDIHSGQNLKRERHIKEAEQSADQFLAILKELINLGEEQDLIVFLSYCDIPVTDATRPILPRLGRPIWDGGMGMRHLGERNLTLFTNVHEAAIHFVDHHFNKLQHHVAYGSINGVPNFMHILLAIGSILRSQLERLLRGLESGRRPLSTSEWFTYRRCIDVYFQEFRHAVDCFCIEYFPRLVTDYGSNEVAKRLDADLPSLNEIYRYMFEFRSRIEPLRTSTIRIMTPSGVAVIPKYFECILAEAQWLAFLKDIQTMLTSINKVIPFIKE